MRYQHGRNSQFPQILTILAGSLIGLDTGIMYGWFSPSIPKIISEGTVTLEEASYFVVLQPLAMLLAAPLFPLLFDRYGRKFGIMLLALPHVLSWIITGLANNLLMFHASRLIAGIADAATISILPVYFGEISEPTVRGVWGNMSVICIVGGKFVINVLGSYFSIKTTAWICICIPLLYGILSVFMPESPYFLLMKGRDDDARKVLAKLRWRDDVDDEMKSMKEAITRQVSEGGTIKDLFTIPSNRRALSICVGLRLAQICSGFTAFDTYTQYLFQLAGGDISEKIAAIIFSAVSLISFAIAPIFVGKFGRRPVAMSSCLGCAVILTIESIYFCLQTFTDVDLSVLNWLPLAGLAVYITVCAPGLGVLPVLMAGELFSAGVKAKATTILIANQALWSLVVPKVFQLLTHNVGLYAPFLLFTVCTYISFFFIYFYVVETRGKTLEEVQQILKTHTNTKE